MEENKRQPDPERERLADAVAWFVNLTHAKYRRRSAEVVQARRELKRLGIIVRFANTKGHANA